MAVKQARKVIVWKAASACRMHRLMNKHADHAAVCTSNKDKAAQVKCGGAVIVAGDVHEKLPPASHSDWHVAKLLSKRLNASGSITAMAQHL